MGTTQETDQSTKFDPGSMGVYQGLQGGLGDMLKGYVQSPFSNPFFQTQQQMGTRRAQNLGGMQMSNVNRNLTASGLGGGGSMSPFAMEMMQNQGRANTGMQANLGFLNPVQNALGMQQWAGGLASQYRPLQTGQSQVQSTGGLGTWLPQVANMAMGALTGLPMGNMVPGLGQGQTPGSQMAGILGQNPQWMGGGGFNPATFNSSGPGGGVPAPPPMPGQWGPAGGDQGGGDWGICWIAAELYNEDLETGARVNRVRNSLLAFEQTSKLGEFVVGLYRRYGRRIAAFIHGRDWVKKPFRLVFDSLLAEEPHV